MALMNLGDKALRYRRLFPALTHLPRPPRGAHFWQGWQWRVLDRLERPE